MGAELERLGIIRGSNKFNIEKLDKLEEQMIKTKFGNAGLLVSDKYAVLPRHGLQSNVPPHRINHHANIFALQKLGVIRIISFTSVGSLKLTLKPTELLMPDDYINFGRILTYYDDKIKHIIPSLDANLIEEIYRKIKDLQIEIHLNGIYIQTQGPRLETKAEIGLFKTYGDVVGMTMASEATLAKELDLRYANISIVDNYCNGILDEPLTMDTIKKNQIKNVETIEKIIERLLGDY
jgi:5'-methylthioadenosine phosphorylase